MQAEWTAHRFSGGVLALDVANTVVHRDRPEARFDRFGDAHEIVRFAEAAARHRAAEVGAAILVVPPPEAVKRRIVVLREATDDLFRDAASTGGLHAGKLATLLRAAADGIAVQPGHLGGPPTDGIAATALETALGLSALSLLRPQAWTRIKVCPTCAWLFLDASRNGSRRWCDMAVCGNRSKAQRNYRKKREQGGDA